MTDRIREAAQALLAEVDRTGYVGILEDTPKLDALRAALAAPPSPGWVEGFRAGIEAAARVADEPLASGLSAVRGAAIVVNRIRAIPVPFAPPLAPDQPERARLYDADAWDGAMDALGKMRERAERAEALARSVGILNAAPEAKTAEGESTERLMLGWQEVLVSAANTLRSVLWDLDSARKNGPPEWLVPPSVAERQQLRAERDAYRTALLAANKRRSAPVDPEETPR